MKKLARFLYIDQLYDVNYSDQILKSLFRSTWAKKKFGILFLMLITVIIRLHIDAILAIIITISPEVDFILQIIISATLVLKSGWIYKIVEKYEHEAYRLSRHLINNYSVDNYRKWKRGVTLTICVYIIIYLSFTEVTSQMLIKQVIQYIICYFIVDFIENKKFKAIFNKNKRKVIKITYNDEFELIDGFIAPKLEPEPGPITRSKSRTKSESRSNTNEGFIFTDNFIFNQEQLHTNNKNIGNISFVE